MDKSLSTFIHQYLRIVLAALMPVALVTFLSIPFTLEGHPGEVRSAHAPVAQHMT